MIHEVEELKDVVAKRYDALGQRATHAELLTDVLSTFASTYLVTGASAHLVDYFWRQGVSKAVSSFLNRRQGSTGLPFAPVANDLRQHVPLDLMQESELQFVGTAYMARAGAQSSMAQRVSAIAEARFGRPLDLSAAA